MDLGFHTEPEPPRLTPLPVRDGIARIVAANPSPLTYHGTNTWLLRTEDGLTVIDPGPDLPEHLDAVAAAGPVARIVLTHTHPDHAGGARALQSRTGAPIHGWSQPWAKDFTPDSPLSDGETIGQLTAIHTPGHASDHLCFALPDGTLFSGDHVMSWSTTIVVPPDGDMKAYMASLGRLQSRQDSLYLPGHGPPLPDPKPLVRALALHRSTRESAIARALTTKPRSETDLVDQLYIGLPGSLAKAAARTVEAHLIKLEAEGRATRHLGGWTVP
jgi:glyoxylase-like metal-dependent hydrolase (beta-lactamase superfamily II)